MCAKHAVLLSPQTFAKDVVLMTLSRQSQTFAKVKVQTMQPLTLTALLTSAKDVVPTTW
jgi:hypothetical protein